MLLAVMPLQVLALVGSLSLTPVLPLEPSPARDAVAAVLVSNQADAAPVLVTLYDSNHRESYVVSIGRDGSVDGATRDLLEHAFRCRRSGNEHAINPALLAMIADVSAHWSGKRIEYVSAYRGHRKESKTSPHRDGRAFDFRIPGVSLIAIRDYAWSQFRNVGVGWYPGDDFVHLDPRPDDLAWTARDHRNTYHPSWADRIRQGTKVRANEVRTGS